MSARPQATGYRLQPELESVPELNVLRVRRDRRAHAFAMSYTHRSDLSPVACSLSC